MNKAIFQFGGRRTRQQKILFIAEHIKQPHGSALSAIDILRSIPSSYKKYILTDHPIPDGPYLHNAVRRSWHPLSLSIKPYRLSQVSSLAFAWLHSLIFNWWLRNAKFDLVVVNGFGSRSLWQKARRFIPRSSTCVLISRESPRHFDSPDRDYTLAEQIQFMRAFGALIFVSDLLRCEWSALAALDQKPTYYLPNCCEEGEFLSIDRDRPGSISIRESYDIPLGIPLILNVGTIELRKGQRDLEPLARHLEERIQDFRIVCVGFDATEEGFGLRKRIEGSPLGRFFLFPGATDQMYSWYEAATMLAFTSRAEAMPRTVLEAMASALPIVSTSVDGIPELIDHLADGYLYRSGDITGLIHGVDYILGDSDRARRMGINARDKYRQRFPQSRHAERLAKIMASVVAM